MSLPGLCGDGPPALRRSYRGAGAAAAVGSDLLVPVLSAGLRSSSFLPSATSRMSVAGQASEQPPAWPPSSAPRGAANSRRISVPPRRGQPAVTRPNNSGRPPPRNRSRGGRPNRRGTSFTRQQCLRRNDAAPWNLAPMGGVQTREVAMRRDVQNKNAAIIAKVTGVPGSPATLETDNDSLNPNVLVKTPSCGAGHSAAGPTARSGRVPRRGAPALRLV